ncbi:MAG: hypothetical protein HY962_11570 [Ignavibacteriae bacterium]|nr:hypothetical protein [Ignavibacteriota bacterium]
MNLYFREKHIPGWTEIPEHDRWFLRQEARKIGWRRPYTWVLLLVALYHVFVGIPFVSPFLRAMPGYVFPVLLLAMGRLMLLNDLASAVRKYLEPGRMSG